MASCNNDLTDPAEPRVLRGSRNEPQEERRVLMDVSTIRIIAGVAAVIIVVIIIWRRKQKVSK